MIDPRSRTTPYTDAEIKVIEISLFNIISWHITECFATMMIVFCLFPLSPSVIFIIWLALTLFIDVICRMVCLAPLLFLK